MGLNLMAHLCVYIFSVESHPGTHWVRWFGPSPSGLMKLILQEGVLTNHGSITLYLGTWSSPTWKTSADSPSLKTANFCEVQKKRPKKAALTEHPTWHPSTILDLGTDYPWYTGIQPFTITKDFCFESKYEVNVNEKAPMWQCNDYTV